MDIELDDELEAFAMGTLSAEHEAKLVARRAEDPSLALLLDAIRPDGAAEIDRLTHVVERSLPPVTQSLVDRLRRWLWPLVPVLAAAVVSVAVLPGPLPNWEATLVAGDASARNAPSVGQLSPGSRVVVEVRGDEPLAGSMAAHLEIHGGTSVVVLDPTVEVLNGSVRVSAWIPRDAALEEGPIRVEIGLGRWYVGRARSMEGTWSLR